MRGNNDAGESFIVPLFFCANTRARVWSRNTIGLQLGLVHAPWVGVRFVQARQFFCCSHTVVWAHVSHMQTPTWPYLVKKAHTLRKAEVRFLAHVFCVVLKTVVAYDSTSAMV